MGWIEQTSFLSGIFGEFSYLAPFVVLVLCGMGLPLPEEVSLIGSGILYYRGDVEFVPIVVVCSVAILIGDSAPFWLGRRYGTSALKIPWVARLIHPERFERLRIQFNEHGNWATFACRFFAGVRIPGYFLAGTMGMRYVRFLVLDLLGVLISVPVSIYLGKLFGGKVDELEDTIQDMHMILAFLALSLVLILVVRHRRQRARRSLARRSLKRSVSATGSDAETGSTPPLSPVEEGDETTG